MNTILIILIVLAAIATVVALVRGVISFLRTTEEELKDGGTGLSAARLKQNKMMTARITFQAIAVLLCAVILLLNTGN